MTQNTFFMYLNNKNRTFGRKEVLVYSMGRMQTPLNTQKLFLATCFIIFCSHYTKNVCFCFFCFFHFKIFLKQNLVNLVKKGYF